MQKRRFITAALGAAALPAIAQGSAAPNLRGPALLTITGSIGKTNRGAFDPVLDQMMGKHKLSFEKAYQFDYPSLASMKAASIQPTLEYDKKPHKLSGPLLADVLAQVGVTGDAGKIAMRAVDGYAPAISLADLRKYRFMVATHLDGKPMPLGGLGPLWAVYDADRFPDMAAKPVDQRFALCPWGLYHIDVQPA